MSRYATTPVVKDLKGIRKQITTITPTVPINQADVYIKTTSPDRLDKLAFTFYEDVTLWWVIAAANGLGKGTYIVPANTTLRIPTKQNVITALNNTNTTR